MHIVLHSLPRAHAVTCQAQQADTRRLAAKSERSSARRRRQVQQQQRRPPTPVEQQHDQDDNPEAQPMLDLWAEALEEEEAELDSVRAAEASMAATDAARSAQRQPTAEPKDTAAAPAPPSEPYLSSEQARRAAAASARESELDGSFGAPPPEVAASADGRQRWEAFMQAANPYDFPVRTMDDRGEAEATAAADAADEDDDEEEPPRPMVQMAEFTDRLSEAPQPPPSMPTDVPAADADASDTDAASQHDDQAEEEEERRGALLMRFMAAGRDLDKLIARYADDIDEPLLEMLYSRIQVAVSDGESEENVDALATLWRRLRAEAERAAASPSERLLDDVLLLLDAPGSSEQRRKQDVEGRLEAAFKPLGDRPVDVFALAEALAQREGSGAAGSSLLDDIVEFVPKAEFIAQTRGMLDEAVNANKRIADRLRSLSEEEAAIVEEALQERHQTAKQVQYVLEIAEGVPDA